MQSCKGLKKENRLRMPLISIEELCCWALSKASYFITNKKRYAKFCFEKSKERKICE
jgi:hypothetical protein